MSDRKVAVSVDGDVNGKIELNLVCLGVGQGGGEGGC